MIATGYQWDLDDPRGYANAMGRYKTAQEGAFIRRHLGQGPRRILDIGGGSGRFALPLADEGHRLTVIDVSQEAIRRLQARAHPRVEAIDGDFLATATSEPFDAAIAIESVQYFVGVDLRLVFANVASRLRPGAPFIFTVLNGGSWRTRLHGFRQARAYNVADAAGYLRALDEAGFALVEARGFMWMPFPVTSNSSAVPFFAALETIAGLRRWLRQSPWLLIAARVR